MGAACTVNRTKVPTHAAPRPIQWVASGAIVFCDSDGVLNRGSATRQAGTAITFEDWAAPLDTHCLQRLADLIELSGASLVFTSSWRLEAAGLRALKNGLSSVGIPQEAVIGATPDLKDGARGDEIAAWLQEHPEFTRWVVLDDRDIKAAKHDGMEARFVQTAMKEGLTTTDVEKAAEILKDAAV